MNGVNFSNDTVNGTGTVIFQVETQGSASVSGVTASNLGDAGVYNYAYPVRVRHVQLQPGQRQLRLVDDAGVDHVPAAERQFRTAASAATGQR